MLISESYREQQQQLHENPNYGVASITYAPIVSVYCNKLGITSLLDYGCGKCRLFKNLKVDHAMGLQAYDPGIPEHSQAPVPSQMVACIDVLEHIEPEHLDAVLDDLQRVTSEIGIFSVHTGPAVKVLSDGRNAHLIQQPMQWWLPKLWDRFEIESVQRMDEHGFFVVVHARED